MKEAIARYIYYLRTVGKKNRLEEADKPRFMDELHTAERIFAALVNGKTVSKGKDVEDEARSILGLVYNTYRLPTNYAVAEKKVVGCIVAKRKTSKSAKR
ncbi:hypothetical protein PG990_010995 [Apiospora arundinis]